MIDNLYLSELREDIAIPQGRAAGGVFLFTCGSLQDGRAEGRGELEGQHV